MLSLRAGAGAATDADAGELAASPTVDGASWPNMSALLVASWAEAVKAVIASATAVKLLVNLNIGLRRDGA
jgi:hypothetical protein